MNAHAARLDRLKFGLALLYLAVIVSSCGSGDTPSAPVSIPPPPATLVGAWEVSDSFSTCDPWSEVRPWTAWTDTVAGDAESLTRHIERRIEQDIHFFTGARLYDTRLEMVAVSDSLIRLLATGITTDIDTCQWHVRYLTELEFSPTQTTWHAVSRVDWWALGPSCGFPRGDSVALCIVLRSGYAKMADSTALFQ